MDYKEKVIALLKSQELSKEQKEKLENIFPELKESEDDRIRKGLITFFSRFPYNNMEDAGINAKDVIAWLEKQGEQKPQRMISAEAKEAMYDKPAWSEEDEDFIYDTLSNLTELKDRYGDGYGNVGKCIDWLKSLKERIGG